MEKDDYSFYNTDKIVELRFQNIWTKYRGRFFEVSEAQGSGEFQETMFRSSETRRI